MLWQAQIVIRTSTYETFGISYPLESHELQSLVKYNVYSFFCDIKVFLWNLHLHSYMSRNYLIMS